MSISKTRAIGLLKQRVRRRDLVAALYRLRRREPELARAAQRGEPEDQRQHRQRQRLYAGHERAGGDQADDLHPAEDDEGAPGEGHEEGGDGDAERSFNRPQQSPGEV
ncbi:MAG: hypothetical protein IT556_19270 [Acetobacteraceae bacterium]|nr:hypothetical protein [Acetobacteraceae bacterium]